jgi:hypothetical protein
VNEADTQARLEEAASPQHPNSESHTPDGKRRTDGKHDRIRRSLDSKAAAK